MPPVRSGHDGLVQNREIGPWEYRLDTIAKLIAVATAQAPGAQIGWSGLVNVQVGHWPEAGWRNRRCFRAQTKVSPAECLGDEHHRQVGPGWGLAPRRPGARVTNEVALDRQEIDDRVAA